MRVWTTDKVTDKSGRVYPLYEMWDESRPRVTYDNGKTGVPSVNLLSGCALKPYSGALPQVVREALADGVRDDIRGTCGQTCAGCYDMKSTRFITVAVKRILNMLEARENPARFMALVERELFASGKTWESIRFNDGGDMPNVEYYGNALAMVARHPSTQFYTYTKARAVVESYGLDKRPHNFALSCSPWYPYCEAFGGLAQFIYDDGTREDVARLPHCPAVNRNGNRTGVKCSQCKHCMYAKDGDKWAVYAH